MNPDEFPDFVQQARDLAARSGLPERRTLEIAAETIRRNRDASTNEQIRFHLSLDLQKVEAALRATEPNGARR